MTVQFWDGAGFGFLLALFIAVAFSPATLGGK